ncbi:DUF1624 domain-containing protein [Mucilaginibacter ginsenosidivorans]|uniref:DUF1624 domain-containing protein n=1 Tax=Mucilaginibacter ginsenosidivorans TaxID=398053 RepID=A0A5B8UX37_9SPHI|nr:heparan-alpha-glucosaminide N-acetyltransferase domain-containing protein [Mucilaginibacter ginsenosidivorans]QEC63245.1 DUF1624 domain-containing protein [Mucilaginibacter ginsenosidivorans]
MTALTVPGSKQRIASIDILRGLVMVIMALDHVRDFFHYGHPAPMNLATTTPILFFTRWITHFCAPTFVFLSGISAYQAGTRRSKNEFRAFLIKRGLWLIIVELLLITLSITADVGYHVFVLEVIWVIACGMILLGLMAGLSSKVIGITGAILIAGHNLLDPQFFNAEVVNNGLLGNLFLTAKGNMHFFAPSRGFLVAYAILPWAGIMMLGYGIGALYRSGYNAVKRRKTLFYLGLAALITFVSLRFINIYGDPRPWLPQSKPVYNILSFLNITKQPPSLLFACITVGTALIFLSFAENIKTRFAAILTTYGSVPLFYFVCHLYILRLGTIMMYFATGHSAKQIDDPNSFPLLFQPVDMGINLGWVYMAWAILVCALYFPCRLYSRYKRTHDQWWLSYL